MTQRLNVVFWVPDQVAKRNVEANQGTILLQQRVRDVLGDVAT